LRESERETDAAVKSALFVGIDESVAL